MQSLDRRGKEIFATPLINPWARSKVKSSSPIWIFAVVETDMTFWMIGTLSLVDEWVHAGAVIMCSLL